MHATATATDTSPGSFRDSSGLGLPMRSPSTRRKRGFAAFALLRLAQCTAAVVPWLLPARVGGATPPDVVTASADVQAPGYFLGLGDLPGGDRASSAEAISADGQTVVGYSMVDGGEEAFRWSFAEGLRGLGDLAGGVHDSRALGVSGDGSVIVGFGHGDAGMEAFRWHANDGLQGLGDFLDDRRVSSLAHDVSDDGRTIVGTGNYSPGGGPRAVTGRAFVWTHTQGLTALVDLPSQPDCSRAVAISPQGTEIVGIGDCDASFQVEDLGQAVRFHGAAPATSVDHTAVMSPRSFATGVSSASTVVGARVFTDQNESTLLATRWSSDGTPTALPTPQAVLSSAAFDLGDSSEVVVGMAYLAAPAGASVALLWDPVRGGQDLRALLASFGYAQVLEWSLEEARGVSADGRTIAGTGTNPRGDREAWVARLALPIAGDFDIDGRRTPVDIDRLTREVRSGGQALPLDADGNWRVEEADREYWVEHLARTWFGDADVDGQFSSQDLVRVFQAGQYEDSEPRNSGWVEGDWDGSGDFQSSDLVLAFQSGGYERGPRTASAVPEPASAHLLVASGILLTMVRHCVRSGLRHRPMYRE
jgi:probable HAF family extracellular repeat protein